MSESKRMVFSNESKLGPSFMTPKIDERKNFHLNIKGVWFWGYGNMFNIKIGLREDIDILLINIGNLIFW